MWFQFGRVSNEVEGCGNLFFLLDWFCRTGSGAQVERSVMGCCGHLAGRRIVDWVWMDCDGLLEWRLWMEFRWIVGLGSKDFFFTDWEGLDRLGNGSGIWNSRLGLVGVTKRKKCSLMLRKMVSGNGLGHINGWWVDGNLGMDG